MTPITRGRPRSFFRCSSFRKNSLAKDWPGFAGALAFTVLTVLTLISLSLRPYRRAPRAARFAGDYIRNPKRVRDSVILEKINAIHYNDDLVASKSRSFKWLLWVTVAALVVFLALDGYNGFKNEHRGTPPTAVRREQQGTSPGHKQPRDRLGPSGKREASRRLLYLRG